jgi:hypothetical protein
MCWRAKVGPLGTELVLEAPWGRNKPAQGNALGKRRSEQSSALKGHNSYGKKLVTPFQGDVLICCLFPKALPWAGLLRPYGASRRDRTYYFFFGATRYFTVFGVSSGGFS